MHSSIRVGAAFELHHLDSDSEFIHHDVPIPSACDTLAAKINLLADPFLSEQIQLVQLLEMVLVVPDIPQCLALTLSYG